MDSYDIVVLGAGSAAEWLWPGIPGRTMAVIEAGRVGGECPYVACMPSKAMLRSARLRSALGETVALGATAQAVDRGDGAAAYALATSRRDVIAEQRDDSGTAAGLEKAGTRLIRGQGHVLRPGVVAVGEIEIGYTDLVINTGALQTHPPVPGLDAIDAWTSESALSGAELPTSLAILGGGAIGCELAQVYAAFGSRVTLIELGATLLPAEHPTVGGALADAMTDLGITVMVGTRLERAERVTEGVRLTLAGAADVTVERVLIAAGRTPHVEGIGLEQLGITPVRGRIPVDAGLRVVGQEHVWAAGDVTGIAPFTHTANLHGRVLRTNLGGGTATADHRAIPRCVFTDPPVACVGLSESAAREAGHDVVTVHGSPTDTARGYAESRGHGALVLIADRSSGLLLGAAGFGPGADDWIGEASLAIHARIPVTTWATLVHPFPTYSEGYEPLLRDLAGQLSGDGAEQRA